MDLLFEKRKRPMPQRVGEFREQVTGKLVSTAYEGDGVVSMRYIGDPTAKPIFISVVDYNDGILKTGILVPTEPMRKSGPIQERSSTPPRS